MWEEEAVGSDSLVLSVLRCVGFAERHGESVEQALGSIEIVEDGATGVRKRGLPGVVCCCHDTPER